MNSLIFIFTTKVKDETCYKVRSMKISEQDQTSSFFMNTAERMKYALRIRHIYFLYKKKC